MIRCKIQTNLRTCSKPATRPWQRTQTQRCGLQKRKYAKAKLGFGTGKRWTRFVFSVSLVLDDNRKLWNTQPDGNTWVSDYHLIWMGGPNLPSGGVTIDLVEMSRKTIRLPINTIQTPQSQHHFSSGYQPCAARLTSPRGLFHACESKTQGRIRKNTIWEIADDSLSTRVGVSQTDLSVNCSWQNNLSKTHIKWWQLLNI
jgi:hypothetical protein